MFQQSKLTTAVAAAFLLSASVAAFADTAPTQPAPTGTQPTGTQPTTNCPTTVQPGAPLPPNCPPPTGTQPTGTQPTGTQPTGTQPTGTQQPPQQGPSFNPMSNSTMQLFNQMFKKGIGGSIYYPNSGKLVVKCLTVSGMKDYYNMTMKQISVSGQVAFALDELTQANGNECQTASPTPPTNDPFLALINGTGTQPTGTQPTGTQPTGTQPTGTQPTGTQPTGTQPTGTQPTGTQP